MLSLKKAGCVLRPPDAGATSFVPELILAIADSAGAVGGWEILAIPQPQIETLGIEFLGRRRPVQRSLKGHRHFLEHASNGANRLVIRRQEQGMGHSSPC